MPDTKCIAEQKNFVNVRFEPTMDVGIPADELTYFKSLGFEYYYETTNYTDIYLGIIESDYKFSKWTMFYYFNAPYGSTKFVMMFSSFHDMIMSKLAS